MVSAGKFLDGRRRDAVARNLMSFKMGQPIASDLHPIATGNVGRNVEVTHQDEGGQ